MCLACGTNAAFTCKQSNSSLVWHACSTVCRFTCGVAASSANKHAVSFPAALFLTLHPVCTAASLDTVTACRSSPLYSVAGMHGVLWWSRYDGAHTRKTKFGVKTIRRTIACTQSGKLLHQRLPNSRHAWSATCLRLDVNLVRKNSQQQARFSPCSRSLASIMAEHSADSSDKHASTLSNTLNGCCPIQASYLFRSSAPETALSLTIRAKKALATAWCDRVPYRSYSCADFLTQKAHQPSP